MARDLLSPEDCQLQIWNNNRSQRYIAVIRKIAMLRQFFHKAACGM